MEDKTPVSATASKRIRVDPNIDEKDQTLVTARILIGKEKEVC